MAATLGGALGAIGAVCIIFAFQVRRLANLRDAAGIRRSATGQRACFRCGFIHRRLRPIHCCISDLFWRPPAQAWFYISSRSPKFANGFALTQVSHCDNPIRADSKEIGHEELESLNSYSCGVVFAGLFIAVVT